MSNGYMILDTSHDDYDAVISACNSIQQSYFPNNGLSIVLNDDETKASVKVAGATQKNFLDYFFPDAVVTSATNIQDLISGLTDSVILMAHTTNEEVFTELAKSEWDDTVRPSLEDVING